MKLLLFVVKTNKRRRRRRNNGYRVNFVVISEPIYASLFSTKGRAKRPRLATRARLYYYFGEKQRRDVRYCLPLYCLSFFFFLVKERNKDPL